MLRSILNTVISRLKGYPYEIDPAIPLAYLVALASRRITMIVRGSLCGIKKQGILFIAPHVSIRGKSLIRVGHGVTIDRGVYIDALSHDGIEFGDNVGMGSQGFWGCAGGITVGSDTIIGNYVSFHSENHNFNSLDLPIRKQGVSRQGIQIGENCWIGAKVTILDGASVGNGCIIAAGAVVRGRFPDCVIIGGVPARILKDRKDFR